MPVVLRRAYEGNATLSEDEISTEFKPMFATMYKFPRRSGLSVWHDVERKDVLWKHVMRCSSEKGNVCANLWLDEDLASCIPISRWRLLSSMLPSFMSASRIERIDAYMRKTTPSGYPLVEMVRRGEGVDETLIVADAIGSIKDALQAAASPLEG